MISANTPESFRKSRLVQTPVAALVGPEVQVVVAVPVEVKEGREQGGIRASLDADRGGHLGEGPVAEVLVEFVPGDIPQVAGADCEVKVQPTVAVEITPGGCLARAGELHARRQSDIREVEVAVVPEEPVGHMPAGKEQVDIPVSVIVRGGHARGGGHGGNPGGERAVDEGAGTVVLVDPHQTVGGTEDDDVEVAVVVQVDQAVPGTELDRRGADDVVHTPGQRDFRKGKVGSSPRTGCEQAKQRQGHGRGRGASRTTTHPNKPIHEHGWPPEHILS